MNCMLPASTSCAALSGTADLAADEEAGLEQVAADYNGPSARKWCSASTPPRDSTPTWTLSDPGHRRRPADAEARVTGSVPVWP